MSHMVDSFRPGQKAILTDLSDEILTIIVEYISDTAILYESTGYVTSRPTKSCLNLSLCSKRFLQIAEPFVYTEFIQQSHLPLNESKSMSIFMCRILARPDLARRVKRYTGNAEPFSLDPEDGDHLDVSSLTAEDWKRVKSAIGQLEIDGEKTTLWDVENGSWEAMTTLILSQLPNLEELTFEGWGSVEEPTSLLSFLSQAALSQSRVTGQLPQWLTRLRQVSLGYWDTEDGLGLRDLVDFMNLKSLRRIHAHMVLQEDLSDWYTAGDGWNVGTTVPSWLKELDLGHILDISFTNSRVDDRLLTCFLSRCQNLRSFTHHWSGSTGGACNFVPPKFMRSLQQVKSSLEELSVLNNGGDSFFEDLEFYPLGSFSSFPKLKSITTSSDILLGNSHMASNIITSGFPSRISIIGSLPSTIETLNIVVQETPLAAPIFELLAQIKMFPVLKQLNLGWGKIFYFDKPLPRAPSEHRGFTAEEALKLLDMCEAAGVEMMYRNIKPPNKFLHGWIDSPSNRAIFTSRIDCYTVDRHVEDPSDLSSSGRVLKSCTMLVLSYPYENWEQLCKEFGCNPETGEKLNGMFT